MLNAYGPWATSLDTGSRPQLSAFWRRRLTMLVPTSQASLALSRRSRLWLGAAAILILAVPTFRPVVAGETSASTENATYLLVANAADETSLNANVVSGTVTLSGAGTLTLNNRYNYSCIYAGSANLPNFLPLPSFLSSALGDDRNRAELKIKPDQESKLREISKDYVKRTEEASKGYEELQKLPKEEMEAKQAELQAKQAVVDKDIRKQVEAVLTAEQWAAAKNIGAGAFRVAARLVSDEELRKTIDLTEEQLKRLVQVNEKSDIEDRILERESRETDQKLLAVIATEQWKQVDSLEQLSGDPNMEFSLLMRAISMPEEELRPQWKDIAFTAEQKTKLKAISTKLEAQNVEMQKSLQGIDFSKLTEEESKAKWAEYDSKMREQWKQIAEQAKSVLTEQQLPILKKLTVEYLFIQRMYDFRDDESNGEKPAGILEQLKVTDEQKKELSRICQERDRMRRQFSRETGEASLRILNPQQQESLLDALDGPSANVFVTGTATILYQGR